MVFDIEYIETNIGWFEVEADNEYQAVQKFWDGVADGKYNLLRTETVENDAVAFERD